MVDFSFICCLFGLIVMVNSKVLDSLVNWLVILFNVSWVCSLFWYGVFVGKVRKNWCSLFFLVFFNWVMVFFCLFYGVLLVFNYKFI